ncbi:energy transducer TonB [Kordia sp. YSTF-M3]|uniref:Energy transducer TonB n=1 Tax=Kordia aestuariivivens TaxID=2759037 RepID=A0ABR7Q3W8_9FLAO|nr:energy transducer TonB [Kordia aestuariivivens]MBC8753223.1 energy transducer TonB [Kordia aestuariivivens]
MKKFIIPALFCLTIQIGFAQKATDMSTPKVAANGTIHFAVMDKAPLLEGCENASISKKQNKCTADKIEDFIQKAFNKDIARSVSNQRNGENNTVYIRFIVNKQGNVENVGVRTNNSSLKAEVLRIVKTLPAFSRGTHQGNAVNAAYSLTLQADRLLRNAVND